MSKWQAWKESHWSFAVINITNRYEGKGYGRLVQAPDTHLSGSKSAQKDVKLATLADEVSFLETRESLVLLMTLFFMNPNVQLPAAIRRSNQRAVLSK